MACGLGVSVTGHGTNFKKFVLLLPELKSRVGGG